MEITTARFTKPPIMASMAPAEIYCKRNKVVYTKTDRWWQTELSKTHETHGRHLYKTFHSVTTQPNTPVWRPLLKANSAKILHWFDDPIKSVAECNVEISSPYNYLSC